MGVAWSSALPLAACRKAARSLPASRRSQRSGSGPRDTHRERSSPPASGSRALRRSSFPTFELSGVLSLRLFLRAFPMGVAWSSPSRSPLAARRLDHCPPRGARKGRAPDHATPTGNARALQLRVLELSGVRAFRRSSFLAFELSGVLSLRLFLPSVPDGRRMVLALPLAACRKAARSLPASRRSQRSGSGPRDTHRERSSPPASGSRALRRSSFPTFELSGVRTLRRSISPAVPPERSRWASHGPRPPARRLPQGGSITARLAALAKVGLRTTRHPPGTLEPSSFRLSSSPAFGSISPVVPLERSRWARMVLALPLAACRKAARSLPASRRSQRSGSGPRNTHRERSSPPASGSRALGLLSSPAFEIRGARARGGAHRVGRVVPAGSKGLVRIRFSKRS